MESVKIPGAAAATWNDCVVTCPLLLMLSHRRAAGRRLIRDLHVQLARSDVIQRRGDSVHQHRDARDRKRQRHAGCALCHRREAGSEHTQNRSRREALLEAGSIGDAGDGRRAAGARSGPGHADRHRCAAGAVVGCRNRSTAQPATASRSPPVLRSPCPPIRSIRLIPTKSRRWKTRSTRRASFHPSKLPSPSNTPRRWRLPCSNC